MQRQASGARPPSRGRLGLRKAKSTAKSEAKSEAKSYLVMKSERKGRERESKERKSGRAVLLCSPGQATAPAPTLLRVELDASLSLCNEAWSTSTPAQNDAQISRLEIQKTISSRVVTECCDDAGVCAKFCDCAGVCSFGRFLWIS
jgi:hypothetical protein